MEMPSWATIRVVLVVIILGISIIWLWSVLTGLWTIWSALQAICCIIDIVAIFYPAIYDRIGNRSDAMIQMVLPSEENELEEKN